MIDIHLSPIAVVRNSRLAAEDDHWEGWSRRLWLIQPCRLMDFSLDFPFHLMIPGINFCSARRFPDGRIV